MIYTHTHLPFVNSRFKRFFINSIFFLVFPCVALCKCFNPSNDDIEQTESTWTRRIIQKELSSDGEQDSEMSRLLKMVRRFLRNNPVVNLNIIVLVAAKTFFKNYTHWVDIVYHSRNIFL